MMLPADLLLVKVKPTNGRCRPVKAECDEGGTVSYSKHQYMHQSTICSNILPSLLANMTQQQGFWCEQWADVVSMAIHPVSVFM